MSGCVNCGGVVYDKFTNGLCGNCVADYRQNILGMGGK